MMDDAQSWLTIEDAATLLGYARRQVSVQLEGERRPATEPVRWRTRPYTRNERLELEPYGRC